MASNNLWKKLKATSQTAAMADMAMLLLIFFLVTTTSEVPEEQIQLPMAATEGTEPNSYYITISASGNIYWLNEPVTMGGLQDKLVVNRNENDRKVVINADVSLDYGAVAKVLELLREYDFLNIMFSSEPRGVAKAGETGNSDSAIPLPSTGTQ